MGLDAQRAIRRSVLITDMHISGADCTLTKVWHRSSSKNSTASVLFTLTETKTVIKAMGDLNGNMNASITLC